MFARSMLIAAAAVLAMGGAAAAEPAKAPQAESGEQRDKAAPILLASADVERATGVVPAAAPDGAAVPAKRKRTARVTTCRCADTPNQ